MNINSGVKIRSGFRNKIQHFHGYFRILPKIPRDYLARQRLFRNISNVLMILLFSLITAGIIVYTSDPGSFSFLRH